MKTSTDHPTANDVSRILLVDDHPLTRQGIRHLIETEPDLEVCGEAETATQALALVESLHPALVLSDLTLPTKDGLEFIKDMKVLHPDVLVLVFSMHDEGIFARRVLRAGARGYVMKGESGQVVLSAVRQVLSGNVYMSQNLSQNFLTDLFLKESRHTEDLPSLTDREFEVFQLIGQGLGTNEISSRLCISVKTVETHRIHLKRKLHLSTPMELVAHAIRWAAANQLA